MSTLTQHNTNPEKGQGHRIEGQGNTSSNVSPAIDINAISGN